MALRKIKEFKKTDEDGDTFSARFRRMEAKEFAAYEEAKQEITQTHDQRTKKQLDLKLTLRHADAKIQLFDILCTEFEYTYANAKGEKVLFGTAKPMSQGEIEWLSKEVGYPTTAKSQLDFIPHSFKVEAITACFESELEESIETEKKS